MVRLNKNLLTDEQLEQLFLQFANLLNKSATNEANLVLQEVLGYEERIMIAKRVAIIVLLIEGYSLYSISRHLKVSPSTAEKIKSKLDKGEFHIILKKLGASKKIYISILETLDSILTVGGIMPHYGQTHKSEAYKKNLNERK